MVAVRDFNMLKRKINCGLGISAINLIMILFYWNHLIPIISSKQ